MYLFWFKLIVSLFFCILIGAFLIIFGTLTATGIRPSFRAYRLLQKLPGPKGYWLIGNAIDVFIAKHNIIPQLSEWFKDSPIRFVLWMLGVPAVILRDADDYQVLLNNTDNLRKGIIYWPLKPWLQEGLLTSDGEKWQSRRKMLTPAFHFKILEDNMSIFNECSQDLVNTFISKQNQEIEIEPHVSRCTLKAIMKAAMGIDLEGLKLEGEKYIETVKSFSEIFTERHLNPILFNDMIFYMLPIGKKYTENVQYLQKFSTGIINERKNNYQNNSAGSVSSGGKVRKAFLDLMLEYEMKNPGALTDKGIREEVDTFMFEGHDTTSSAMHFTLYSLALYQDVQEKVFAELLDIFGNSDRDINTQDLSKMRFLEKVIKESLRLYPSVPGISRFLEKDLILNDGTVIPARTDTICMIYLLHRNKKYWSDPDKFDPERFSEENIQGRHPFCYVPFSAGPRNCIGQKFAMMELKTVIANIVRKLKILTVTELDEIVLVDHLVLRSLTPIKFKFIERSY